LVDFGLSGSNKSTIQQPTDSGIITHEFEIVTESANLASEVTVIVKLLVIQSSLSLVLLGAIMSRLTFPV